MKILDVFKHDSSSTEQEKRERGAGQHCWPKAAASRLNKHVQMLHISFSRAERAIIRSEKSQKSEEKF
jgi:hypothetical protein